MKFLHTADWHVGKSIKGQSRLDEHRAVLRDIVRIAETERVDAVLIAGDVYETSAPSPEAESLVLRTLLDLRDTGARVVVLAGNHDNPHRFEAVRPVFAALDVTVIGLPRRPDDGGVIEVTGANGDDLRLALVPFCSRRSIIRSAQLMELDASDLSATYDERMRQVIDRLAARFRDDAVNVVVAHGMVTGARTGGGERRAQTEFMDYWIGAAAFPAQAHYVALGHVHRTQQIGGGAPIWYSGAPLQVDFGDTGREGNVLIVEATPSTPAQVRTVAVVGGRELRTVHGTLEALRELAGTTGDAYLRVVVEDPLRAGLSDDVREMLGETVVDVVLAGSPVASPGGARRARLTVQTPHELFATYLGEQGVDDARLLKLFDELLDEETG